MTINSHPIDPAQDPTAAPLQAAAHAVYSPSGAHRWFACPGSIRLSEGIPRVSSRYADEGSAAHLLATMCFETGTDPGDHLGRIFTVDDTSFTVDESMAEAVTVFTDHVRSYTNAGYSLEHEVRLDLGHLWPGQFGTGDAILFHSESRHLAVADLKYGAGVLVSPEENPQILSYASGAARKFAAVQTLTLTIVQPRAPGQAIKAWDTTPRRLLQFELEFRAAAAATQLPDAPLIPGDHCQFCPATGVCPALRNRALSIARVEFGAVSPVATPVPPPVPATLSSEEIGRILSQAVLVETWIEGVRRIALQRAIADNDVPMGWKLVRKNTHRKWGDEPRAARALTKLYELPEDEIWARKLRSPAQIEKLLPKSDRDQIEALIVQPLGDVTLAPIADRRHAMTVDALDEFRSTQKSLSQSQPQEQEDHDLS